MAERKRKRQPSMHCQIHFLPDRHVLEKLAQAYHWLVPKTEPESTQQSSQLTTNQRAKDRSHLRSSFL